ncbi:winged helix-turn-helix domain-containing protein [Streptomyces sp. NBC_00654]|uniref:winged helix-turn-helix domain-containing protein n=1 Tax=Streptomyces sp. NBC_00654 TaxID=2975799 RepID=UPI002252D54B|nr:winged helix-turn-helix domain-containing protein [Streptomyces sp. NBC_00654]MCX4966685.1 winged helix-turn-helix domain-containing protein [Streptomyces sp. NBC_00654]
MRAVDLFEEDGEVPCIARELRVSEKSVYQWRRSWRAGGREALRSKGPSGYDRHLGPHLQAELAMWLEEGPAAHGWADDQVWTAARVRTLIGRKFHFSYSVSGVTRLLHRMGYSVQMPARPAAERDEDAITAWREVNWPEVEPSERDWLTVVLLPGYAPELNPVEGLWARIRWSLANLAARALSELEAVLRRRLNALQYWHAVLGGFLAGTGLALEGPN